MGNCTRLILFVGQRRWICQLYTIMLHLSVTMGLVWKRLLL